MLQSRKTDQGKRQNSRTAVAWSGMALLQVTFDQRLRDAREEVMGIPEDLSEGQLPVWLGQSEWGRGGH